MLTPLCAHAHRLAAEGVKGGGPLLRHPNQALQRQHASAAARSSGQGSGTADGIEASAVAGEADGSGSMPATLQELGALWQRSGCVRGTSSSVMAAGRAAGDHSRLTLTACNRIEFVTPL